MGIRVQSKTMINISKEIIKSNPQENYHSPLYATLSSRKVDSLNSLFPCSDLVRKHGWKRVWQVFFFFHPSPQHLNSFLHEKNSTYEESWLEAETMPLHKRGKPMFSNMCASRHGTRPHQSGNHMTDSDSGHGDTERLGLHRIHLARVAGVA